jgi:hypothetical protein
MADPVAVVKADVASVKAKVVAFAKAHVPTVVGASSGYLAGKFGLIGLLFKVL